MKTLVLNCKVDDLDLAPEDKTKTGKQLLVIMIKNIIFTYSQQKQGLTEQERRQFYKIEDVLESAVEQGLEEVQLDDEWMGFIRKCFRETKLFPSVLLRRVEDILEQVKDR